MSIPPRTTFELAKEQLMIEMQDLLVPYRQIPNNLQRFCRPLAFYNEGTALELSVSGSAFLFRQCGRNFLLCCNHQLANHGRGAEDLVVIVDGDGATKRRGLAPNEATRIDPDPQLDEAFRDLEDVFLAEYRSREKGVSIDPLFLRFNLDHAKDLNQVEPDDIDLIFAIGYPAVFADYDPEYNANWETIGLTIISRWVKLYLEPVAPTDWDLPGLTPMQMRADQHEPIEQPDGLSGSPVFFIHGGKRPALGFAGMIVRADRRGRINMLDARIIRQAVAHHLATSVL